MPSNSGATQTGSTLAASSETSRAEGVRTLVRHLSRENWPFLETVESPHTVANYWKRVLADMPEPLVTFSLYELVVEIIDTAGDQG